MSTTYSASISGVYVASMCHDCESKKSSQKQSLGVITGSDREIRCRSLFVAHLHAGTYARAVPRLLQLILTVCRRLSSRSRTCAAQSGIWTVPWITNNSASDLYGWELHDINFCNSMQGVADWICIVQCWSPHGSHRSLEFAYTKNRWGQGHSELDLYAVTHTVDAMRQSNVRMPRRPLLISNSLNRFTIYSTMQVL